MIARLAAQMRKLLAEPSTAGLDTDSPEVTLRRRALIQSRGFLRQLYQEWYSQIEAAIPRGTGPLLELGSGGGFASSAIPGVITSDLLPLPGIDVVLDGVQLPFADKSLRGVVMTNVLHHLPDVARFLKEFERCAKPNGKLVMIEPWVTAWSRKVYGNLHSEPFDPEAQAWTVAPGRPLSEANGALPWIVFERDRRRFAQEFPALVVETIRPLMPMSYLVSGGVSMRSLAPSWSFRFWKKIDGMLCRLSPQTAMFALIVVRRN